MALPVVLVAGIHDDLQNFLLAPTTWFVVCQVLSLQIRHDCRCVPTWGNRPTCVFSPAEG